MSAKSNKTMIGAFVVGAIALAVGGVLILGSGKFFRDNVKVAFYFEGSVAGLGLGAPIVLKGVKIGVVDAIRLQYDLDTGEFRTLVAGKVQDTIVPVGTPASLARLLEKAEQSPDRMRRDLLADMVARGLRAQLGVQSFVTGMLQVALDYHEDVELAKVTQNEAGQWVLPTVPSSMEQLSATFEKLPLAEIVDKMNDTLQGLDHLINSKESKESLSHLMSAVASADHLVARLDKRYDTIDSDVLAIVDLAKQLFVNGNDGIAQVRGEIDSAVQHAEDFIRNLNDRVGPMANDVSRLSDAAFASLTEAKDSLAAFRGIAVADSIPMRKVMTTLDALTAAMDNLKVLLAYLEQHPEALLRGK